MRQRLHQRWACVATAVLGAVVVFCGTAIEGDNADLLAGTDPTIGDDGTGFWWVLIAAGLLLVAGAVLLFLRPIGRRPR